VPLHLCPFARGDYERLIASAESPDFLYQWAGPLFTFPLDRLQLERYLLTAIGDPPTHRIYTALDETGEPAGHIELANIDRLNRSANIARVLVFAGRRGQGLGRELLTLALAVGFDEFHLHRISLYVFDFNQAAITAYERAGMVKEGYLRDVRRVGDRYWSVYQMSMLEDDWRARRLNGRTPPAPPAPA
jgi:RimJ/RimL family protein N-acetyltransferase